MGRARWRQRRIWQWNDGFAERIFRGHLRRRHRRNSDWWHNACWGELYDPYSEDHRGAKWNNIFIDGPHDSIRVWIDSLYHLLKRDGGCHYSCERHAGQRSAYIPCGHDWMDLYSQSGNGELHVIFDDRICYFIDYGGSSGLQLLRFNFDVG